MNREIKFRCFGKESKKWFYYNEIQGRHSITPDQECSESFQYTGLKDRQGKEIYEGDIMNHKPKNQMVFFEKGCFMLYKGMELKHCVARNKLKVIGNQYENPELLGAKNE